MRNAQLLQQLGAHLWAILPERLAAILRLAQDPKAGRLEIDRPAAAEAADPMRGVQVVGAVGVLQIVGGIVPRGDMFSALFGEAPIDVLSQRFAALVQAPEVKTILLVFDSPGGVVDGVPEFADQIFQARSQKRIVAVAAGTAASAAYWLASQAHDLVVQPSGMVGSIGVFVLHEDWSRAADQMGVTLTLLRSDKFKAEGNPFEPLTPEAKDRIQAQIETVHDMFVKAVARGRGVAPAVVRKDFGQGRALMAQEALRAGMVDRVATLGQTLQRALDGGSRRTAANAAMSKPEFEALLRDGGGLARDAAKQITALAFKEVLSDPGNGAEEELQAAPREEGGIEETAEAVKEFMALQQKIPTSLRGTSHGTGAQGGD